MSINKKYVMAGMLATALVAPMTDVTNSHADDTRTITGRVNFRTGPSKSYDSMGKIEKGKTVTYLGSNGSWRKIKYNSKTGYVHKDYISDGTSTSTSEKYVNTSAGLNVRKGPSTSYAKIATLTNGTKVKVITTSGDWSKISSGSITGYVSNQYLSSKAPSSGNTSDNDSNETSITKYVDASVGLNVRKGAGTNYSVITTLSHGTKVTVKSTSNGWSKITSGSVTGYVSSSYLSSSKPSTGNNSNSETSTTKYVDSKAGLNVRKGAGTSYSVITTLSHGTKVTVKST
ncbi:SH3 domain-containing protein, partial [Terrisporobacter glycolicus]